MALIHVSTYAEALRRNTEFHVLIPDREPGFVQTAPVLVLLHGWAGNRHDWLLGSEIARHVQERGFIAVLPSGGNHFYLDDEETEERHSRWLVDELPTTLGALFGIVWDRKRCYLGGYSMGGYGALRNGLAFPERFAGVIALSSALITAEIAALRPGDRTPYAGYGYYRQVFGPLKSLLGSDRDVEALAARFAAKPQACPRLYLACGTEDFLLEPNRSLLKRLREVGLAHTAVEVPGGHDFAFWNQQLAHGVAWMFEDSASWS